MFLWRNCFKMEHPIWLLKLSARKLSSFQISLVQHVLIRCHSWVDSIDSILWLLQYLRLCSVYAFIYSITQSYTMSSFSSLFCISGYYPFPVVESISIIHDSFICLLRISIFPGESLYFKLLSFPVVESISMQCLQRYEFIEERGLIQMWITNKGPEDATTKIEIISNISNIWSVWNIKPHSLSALCV